MFKWIGKWWRQHQRSIDMKALWPMCVKQARDLDHAKAVFMYHCINDPAWTIDYTEEDLIEFIDQLKGPDYVYRQ